MIGASASDIRFSETVTLQTTLVDLPCLLNRESTIREWVDDPRGRQVCDPILQQMLERMGNIFGASEKPAEAVSRELMDMPLLSILHFQEKELPLPADDLVDSMLAQVHGRKA